MLLGELLPLAERPTSPRVLLRLPGRLSRTLAEEHEEPSDPQEWQQLEQHQLLFLYLLEKLLYLLLQLYRGS